MKLKSIAIAIGCVAAMGCNSTNLTPQSTPQVNNVREQAPYLSQEQASFRSQRVSNPDYQLNFHLDGSDTFRNSTKIRFDLSDKSQDLTIDLNQANVKSVVVNGKSVAINYNNYFVTLSAADLIVGSNNVTIEFERKHSTNGEGLHRMQDPVDGKVYLYSHFEPAAAQQMFALFDQPDLKANYQMTVTAPKDWVVFTAMKESNVREQGEFKTWHFDRTLKLSPYNFSLHAGPYHMWQDNSGKYPLRLFARQSVTKQVEPNDWFTYTQQGLKFFEAYYGIDYPFRKYDQVLVPDFLYGAMENAAAITFAEGSFLTASKMTDSQRLRLAKVIMHEMAHQWFGNLVTMKWWNGLWLNESFAAFMATLATAEATEFNYAWQSFYSGEKQSAYRQDQLVTSHPIEVPIATSANAFDNIDAITYSKGASVLKQLTHLLGEEVFRQGIHNYLSSYAYKNAELNDFITALSDAADRDLTQWTQDWLYQPGVNTISAQFECKNNKVSKFAITQTADPIFPTLREQKVQLASFKLDGGKLIPIANAPVIYKGKTTQVDAMLNSQCPDFVYPNYQDWAFVKVNFDKTSFNTAKSTLGQIDDVLLRSMVWQSLWDSASDGQISLKEYLDVALSNIANESDYTILGQALSQISAAQNYLAMIYPHGSRLRTEVDEKIEDIAWQQTQRYKDNKSMQRRWFAVFFQNASSAAAISKMEKLLNNSLKIDNLEIDQDLRWNIITQLNRINAKDSLALIDKELMVDNSDTGQKSAIRATVIRPDAEIKRHWLTQIQQNPDNLPFSKIRTAMFALYSPEQVDLSEQSAELRISTLSDIDKTKDHAFMRSYANALIPTACSVASVQRLEKVIVDQQSLSAGTKRALKVAHQNEQRCLKIKQKLSAK